MTTTEVTAILNIKSIRFLVHIIVHLLWPMLTSFLSLKLYFVLYQNKDKFLSKFHKLRILNNYFSIVRVPMEQLVGKDGEKRLAKLGMEQMLVSMGHQACGALSLWNYPSWMRKLIAHDVDGDDRPDPVDMAAMESKSNTFFFVRFASLYLL